MFQININNFFKTLMQNDKLREMYFASLSDNLGWYLQNDKLAESFFIKHFKSAVQEDKEFAREVQNIFNDMTKSLLSNLGIDKPKVRQIQKSKVSAARVGKASKRNLEAAEKRRKAIVSMLKSSGHKGLTATEIIEHLEKNNLDAQKIRVYSMLNYLKNGKIIKSRKELVDDRERSIYYI